MTLLDWFAGQALQGLISKLPVIDQTGEFEIKVSDKIAYNRDVAESCYELASAMLAEKARREATCKDGLQVPDHSADAGKMARLEGENRELVGALRECDSAFAKFCPDEDSRYGMAWKAVRDALAKAKEIKP